MAQIVGTAFEIPNPSKVDKFKHLSFIRRGTSSTRSVLYYLKMRRGRKVSSQQVAGMFPSFFRRPSDAVRILNTLAKNGLASVDEDSMWAITELGYRSVYLLGERDRMKYVSLETNA